MPARSPAHFPPGSFAVVVLVIDTPAVVQLLSASSIRSSTPICHRACTHHPASAYLVSLHSLCHTMECRMVHPTRITIPVERPVTPQPQRACLTLV
ncbi:hypothetical protein VTO73DRAFT_13771 [Trametes versicolor]